ncbi:MAG: NAD-dependent epimerase/dehydratase family protein [Actinomycetota bacterium]
MKVFVTGATGFIGSGLAHKLLDRGDEVVALVRNPGKASTLAAAGATLAEGDLGSEEGLRSGMSGADAVIHCAAVYKVGMPEKERPAMYEANVTGTERVLRTALDEKIPRVLYISTVNAFGNTEGEVVDETYEHKRKYVSYYDETKHRAHLIARKLIDEEGLPGIIVQPGSVYGPGDQAEVGNLLRMFVKGRLPLKMFPEMGLNMVHRDDVVDGIILALDKGRIGEAYVLGGEIGTLGDMIDTAAEITGRKAPKRSMPPALMKMSAPFGPLTSRLTGFPPNLKEAISASSGVTYWARHDKAMNELGYSPRSLQDGLRQTLREEGLIKN